MKKFVLCAALFAVMMCSVFASVSLDGAIQDAAKNILAAQKEGTRVAVVNINTSAQGLSDYIIEELMLSLLKDKKLVLVERRNLNYIREELKRQTSGEVNEDTILSIGKLNGAEMIILGELIDVGKNYRLRVNTIAVESGTREDASTFDVPKNKAFDTLFAGLSKNSTIGVSSSGADKIIVEARDERAKSGKLTAGDYLDRGIFFESIEDYDMAISCYDDAIRLQPDMLATYYRRGTVYVINKENDKAIADYTQVIKLDPNDMPGYYAIRGALYDRKHEFDKAISDYTQAIKLGYNYAAYFHARGFMYAMKGNDAQALTDYTQAIKLDPNDSSSYFARGKVYLNQQNPEKALAEFTLAIKLGMNDAFSYLCRGTAYLDMRNFDKAIEDFTQSIKLDPNNNIDAYNNRGLAYISKGEWQHALNDFTQIVNIDPTNTDAKEAIEYIKQRMQ
jgi:tetratricopeptide (TPR) repeat protein